MGQHHRWRANINPALVQSIVPARTMPPACRYQQNKVLTRTEWIYWPAPATLTQHLTDIGSAWSRPAVSCKQYQTSCYSQQTQNICIAFVQRRPNVFDVGPTLYKCFVFTGLNAAKQTRGVEPVLVRCWASVTDGGPALDRHWVNVVFAGSVDKCFAPNGIISA